MNKKILGIILITILVITSFIYFRQGSKKIKIGVITVLSGDKKDLGTDFQKGIEDAKKEYMRTHWSTSLDIVYEDDGYDGEKGLKAFDKLVNKDHVDALIIATTPTMTSVYPSVSKLRIPVITYGSQGSEEIKDNVFSLFPAPIFADMALGSVLRTVEKARMKDVVGVYTDDPSLTKLYGAFQQAFDVDIIDIPLSLNTIGTIKKSAQKAYDLHAKYIFMSNYAETGAQFIKSLKEISGDKLQQKFIFDLTLNASLADYEKILGNLSFLDGSIVISTQKVDPTNLRNFGHDALTLLVSTYTPNTSSWIESISTTKIKGTTGDIQFDETGRRIPVFSVTTIKDGKIPEYK